MQHNTNHTFPRFPELPTEIRIKIWRLVVQPRLVNFLRHPAEQVKSMERSQYAGPPRNPALLSVNAEARHEILPLYPKCLELVNSRNTEPRGNRVTFRGARFNKDVDTFCVDLNTLEAFTRYRPDALENLQHAVVYFDIAPLDKYNSHLLDCVSLLRECNNLKKIYICTMDPSDLENTNSAEAAYKETLAGSFQNYGDMLSWQVSQIEEYDPGPTEWEVKLRRVEKRWKDAVRVMFDSEMRERNGGLLSRRKLLLEYNTPSMRL